MFTFLCPKIVRMTDTLVSHCWVHAAAISSLQPDPLWHVPASYEAAMDCYLLHVFDKGGPLPQGYEHKERSAHDSS